MSGFPLSGDIWFAGCGAMAGAILRRWLDCGLPPERVTVIDPAAATLQSVRWVAGPPPGSPTLLVLGIKPQLLHAVAPLHAASAKQHTMVLSMLAGVELGALNAYFPQAGAIVRAMPNLASAIGKGVTGLMMMRGTPEMQQSVDAIMRLLGITEWLRDEEQFHAVTAISGSGPAFLYRFVAATARAGAELGLPEAQALRLAKAMVEGAASLAANSPDHPDAMAERVASTGGTTAEGLAVLDGDARMDTLMADTLSAAARRSRELAEAMRGNSD